jgi:hypothetical protein
LDPLHYYVFLFSYLLLLLESLDPLHYYVFQLNNRLLVFQLMTALEEDEFARKNKLSYKLDQVHTAMEGHTIC